MKTRLFFLGLFFVSNCFSSSSPFLPKSSGSSGNSSGVSSPRSTPPFGRISPSALLQNVKRKLIRPKPLSSGLMPKDYEAFIAEAQSWSFDDRSRKLQEQQWTDERLKWMVDNGVWINFYYGLDKEKPEFYSALRVQMGRLLSVCKKLVAPTWQGKEVSGEDEVFRDFLDVLNGATEVKNTESDQRIKKLTTLIAFNRYNGTTFTDQMRIAHNQRRATKGKETKGGVRALSIMALDTFSSHIDSKQMDNLKTFCQKT